jgi:hypothetical protein
MSTAWNTAIALLWEMGEGKRATKKMGFKDIPS